MTDGEADGGSASPDHVEDTPSASTAGTEDASDGNGRTDGPLRRGSVDLRTRGGDRVHHDEVFVRYDSDVFVLCPDESFPEEATERYRKADVAWIEVRHPRH